MEKIEKTPIKTTTQTICKYCTITTTCMQCNECREYFCNKKITSASHIIFHFIKELHNQIRLTNGDILKCFFCNQTNFFNLGTYENIEYKEFGNNLNLNNLICRTCHESKDEFNRKEEDFKCLLFDRSALPILCPNYGEISNNMLTNLENSKYYELPNIIEIQPISIFNQLEFYIENFTNMIILEAISELNIKEKMARHAIHVNIEIIGEKEKKIVFVSPVDKSMLCLGDEIRLYRNTEKITEVISGKLKMESILNSNNQLTGAEIYELLKQGYKKNRDMYFDKYDYLAVCVISRVDKLIESEIIYERGEFSNKLSIEFVWNSSNFSRMMSSITKLRDSNIFLKEAILNGKYEEEEEAGNEKYKMPKFKSFNKIRINDSQQSAIETSLNNKLTLIQGPPGTGKSLCVSIIAYNFALKGKVLICAPSNVAIDNLSKKLLEIIKKDLKIIRILSKCRELINDKEEDISLNNITLHNMINKLKKEKSLSEFQLGYIRDKLIRNANIIICTCITSGKKLIDSKEFDYVIIDESVQATEPTILIPLLQTKKKCVLVGDHKQLGPVINNHKLVRCKYNRSLFERLILAGIKPILLSVQYRMNHKLCEWPSNEFYSGMVITDLSVNTKNHKIITKKLIPSTFFWCSMGHEESSMSGSSYLNINERDLSKQLVKYLKSKGVNSKEIGIITPYEGQRDLIENSINDLNIEVASIDAFQGREKDFIIFSAVRSNSKSFIGFLKDRRRLNVALTRAKSGLFIIGNPFTLMENKTWLSLLKFYQKENKIFQGNIEDLKPMDLLIKEERIDLGLKELSLKERFNFDLPL